MKRDIRFRIVDVLLLIGAVLPFVAGIVLKVLTNPPSEGIEISGARIYFTLPTPVWELPITESQVNSWLVMLSILCLCLYLTHGITVRGGSRRQHLAEWIVEKTDTLVRDNMGEYFKGFSPFIGAIMALSACSSLMTLCGLYPPTSDINISAGWALMVFFLITYYKFKCGPLVYLESFAQPVPLLTPLNIISEVATPVSMAFRHYGNILSGTVVSVLVAAALQIGLPAILSLYFDIFSGCLQAFIFAMLTMLYISGAFPADEYEERRRKKLQVKQVH